MTCGVCGSTAGEGGSSFFRGQCYRGGWSKDHVCCNAVICSQGVPKTSSDSNDGPPSAAELAGRNSQTQLQDQAKHQNKVLENLVAWFGPHLSPRCLPWSLQGSGGMLVSQGVVGTEAAPAAIQQSPGISSQPVHSSKEQLPECLLGNGGPPYIGLLPI